MTSNLKIRANRENVLQDSGPKTQSGPKRPKVEGNAHKLTTKKSTAVALSPKGTGIGAGKLQIFGGSDSDAFNEVLIEQVMQAVWILQTDKEKQEKHVEAVIVAMKGIKPKDELEGMLAVQILVTHNAAMESFRRARAAVVLEESRENLNQAIKLTRSYLEMIAALDSHRGKGQQHVSFGNVQVNQGVQAIVANVSPRVRGEIGKIEEQPHAPAITHEPGTPVPRPDSERKAVPVAGRKGKGSL
jgi:hypothetical protein